MKLKPHLKQAPSRGARAYAEMLRVRVADVGASGTWAAELLLAGQYSEAIQELEVLVEHIDRLELHRLRAFERAKK